MSDLGTLFHLCAASQKPLENFTTAALAIAIRQDDRPMKQALTAVDWTCRDDDGTPVTLDGISDPVSIRAETQVILWPGAATLGYLDLVLHLGYRSGGTSEIWVEVKVDAWESGTQLKNYKSHAALKVPPPPIITLGRTRVSPRVPSMKWFDVVAAVDLVSNPHYAWASLREFLLEEKIVRPPLPMEPVPTEAKIEALLDINRRIGTLWPNVGSALVWWDGALQKALKVSFEANHELVATAGPLRYGLVSEGPTWAWQLSVTHKNYERIRLDPEQIIIDAQTGELPDAWRRHRDRPNVLERRLPISAARAHEDILRWFDEGLRQLRDSKILNRYLEGVSAKRAAANTRPQVVPAD